MTSSGVQGNNWRDTTKHQYFLLTFKSDETQRNIRNVAGASFKTRREITPLSVTALGKHFENRTDQFFYGYLPCESA
jgi:hypothetical protein